MIVRFDKAALLETQRDKENALGVENPRQSGQVSEADKIVRDAELKLAQNQSPAVGGDATLEEEEPNSVAAITAADSSEVCAEIFSNR